MLVRVEVGEGRDWRLFHVVRASSQDEDEAAIEWLKLLLAVVAAAALTVIYFLLPRPTSPGPLLNFVVACIPNLVTALIVFPAVFLVLGRVGQSSEDRLARVVQRSIG